MALLQSAKQVVKKMIVGVMLDAVLPAVYRWQARKPVKDNQVLFVEVTNPCPSNSLLRMFDHLGHEYGCDTRFVSLGSHRMNTLMYFRNCTYMAYLAATSRHIFYCEGEKAMGCLPLRNETTAVQLWHGCGAFKKFGMSTAEKVFGGNRREQTRHPLYRNAALVTVSSPEVVWAYAEAMSLPEDTPVIQPVGVSRSDFFFDDEFLSWARGQVAERIPESRGKKVVLYAPTFRGRVAQAEAPDALDLAAMAEALRGTHVLLVKHHPHIKKPPAIPAELSDFAFDVTRSMPIEVLMAASDCCISDYSSLVFEYSLLGRPLIFFAYDLDDYDDWRGFYYDYADFTPGPVVKTTAEVVECVLAAESRPQLDEVEAFRDKFMSSCDGSATARIAELTLTDELPSRLPPEAPFPSSPATEAPFPSSPATEAISSVIPSGAPKARSRGIPAKRSTQDEPLVSIVVPAYNACPHVEEALESVVSQTMPHELMELIVVDDCSTDGTWELVCEYQRRYPQLVRAFRLERNSGSPAAPRNKGLEEVRGDYVFFLDADDWLAPRAVERMVRHAREWGSDVMLVKMVSEGGRSVPRKQFKGNRPKADLYSSGALDTFGPLKLFRTSLLRDNGLSFPTDFMPEDISFVLRAYAGASRVSIAGDYGYYHCRLHDMETQSAFSTWSDLDSNLRAFRDVLSVVDALDPEKRSTSVMPRIFRRDVRRMVATLAGMPREDQAPYLQKIRDLFGPYYDEPARSKLRLDARAVLDPVLTGDEQQALTALQQVCSPGFLDRCAVIAEEGRLRYELELDSGERFSGDVTDTAKFSCRLERVGAGDEGLALEGSLDPTVTFGFMREGLEAVLVAKELSGAELEWPAECSWTCSADGEGELKVEAAWTARLPYGELVQAASAQGKRETRWRLSVRVRCQSWTRERRLASTASPLARLAFSECGGTVEGCSVSPAASTHGMMDLVVRSPRG